MQARRNFIQAGHAMTAGETKTPARRSEFGVAACVVGGVMLGVQLIVLLAVISGVQDNQGTIYAATIPLVTYCVGVPAGLSASVAGFFQRERDRKFAKLGLVLTLAGPTVFALSLVVLEMLR